MKQNKTENKFYDITDWRGYPNYECKHCAFATLSKEEMTKHIEAHIKGNPELAGTEVLEELLPDVSEDYRLETVASVEEKETYSGPKKGKGKKGKK